MNLICFSLLIGLLATIAIPSTTAQRSSRIQQAQARRILRQYRYGYRTRPVFPQHIRTTTSPRPIPQRPSRPHVIPPRNPIINTPLSPPELDEKQQISCKPKPSCPTQGDRFYRPDGSCNNPLDGSRGQTGRAHKRLVPADYLDGRGLPKTSSNRGLPSARAVSVQMQDAQTRKSRKHTHLLVIFGQFLSHDISLTPKEEKEGLNCDNCQTSDPACFNIRVPRNDIQGKSCMSLVRSQAMPDDQCNSQVRQQGNNITPYIDGGVVYGNSESQFNDLLDGNSGMGKLKTGPFFSQSTSSQNSQSLPMELQVNFDIPEDECRPVIRKPQNFPCLAAGDIRANENSILASFHTLFLRKHNFLVEELHFINPGWNRDRLANTARMIVSAVLQRITYKEFLPEILGNEYMKRFQLNLVDKGYWKGYDASFDATTSNAFATAAMRFGHTLLTSHMTRPSSSYRKSQSYPNLRLNETYFNAVPLLNQEEGGINSIFRGLASDAAESADPTFVDDIHNFLFAEKGKYGDDLLARNIQRGRDHGLPGYNKYREFCGLKKALSFSDLSDEMEPNRIKSLRRSYGHVDDIDLYIAGLAESPVQGGLFGPTFSCILGYQYRDIRKGDRLWHENGGDYAVFTQGQLKAIREYTLARLLCDHTEDTISVQSTPFQQVKRRTNPRITCPSHAPLNLEAWRDGSTDSGNTEMAPEQTAWFPTVYENTEFQTVQQLLNYLLQNRPEDVCENLLGVEERIVRGYKQYRFSCPPGSIRATDYPNVDASKGSWTEWFRSPSRLIGIEHESRNTPPHTCIQPIAIQVFTTSNTPAQSTGEVFNTISPSAGFLCRGNDQPTGRCQNYQVRYFCKSFRDVQENPSLPQDLAFSKARLCGSYGVCCA